MNNVNKVTVTSTETLIDLWNTRTFVCISNTSETDTLWFWIWLEAWQIQVWKWIPVYPKGTFIYENRERGFREVQAISSSWNIEVSLFYAD